MASKALSALTDIPRSIAIPAALATAAYINGRWGVASDVWGIGNAIRLGAYGASLDKKDRANFFYKIEDFAQDPKTKDNLFLIIPKDEANPSAQTEWTFAQAYEVTLKYARWLKEVHNVQKNEIVAMDFTNRPAFIWVWFGLWSLGAKPAFINSNLRSKAFVHCVKVSTTRLLLVDPHVREVLDEESKAALGVDEKGRAVECIVVEDDVTEKILQGTPYRAPDEQRSGETVADQAIMIYTSGTTGLPKAANVNWGKPHSGGWFFPKVLQLTPQDRYMTALPLYHSSGSVLGVCQAFGYGTAIVLIPKFSPRTYMKQAQETGATVTQYIGEMCRYLISTPPSPYDKTHKLRLAFGNGMRPDVWQRYKDRFSIPEIVEFYGATEGPRASFVVERNGFTRGAIGRHGGLMRLIFGHNSVLIKHDVNTDTPYRDPQTGLCVKLGTDQIGELVHPLDPANIKDQFQGYFGNDKASSSKILRDVLKKGDAYYRTGDLQKRDADGRWWFVDRIGDTFRWKSENVSTAEVSEALGQHPAIREANVYGVELPNHDGRAGCAAIGLVDGQQLDESLRRALAAEARKRLPRYAVPIFLRVSKEMQTTGTMKHQKATLRNEGVDPSKTGEDELFWLPPGAEAYVPFGKEAWEKVRNGAAKL